jgi:hypothetical protein
MGVFLSRVEKKDKSLESWSKRNANAPVTQIPSGNFYPNAATMGGGGVPGGYVRTTHVGQWNTVRSTQPIPTATTLRARTSRHASRTPGRPKRSV